MNTSASDHWPRRVAIIGVGLLGGSASLSIRRLRPNCQFVGYSRSVGKLDDAMARGVIDEATDSIQNAVRGCDVVLVATPVDRIAEIVIEAAGATSSDCLITDVGSTKASIVDEVESHPAAAAKFVAAHPIAGSEKSGCEHATESLFDGKMVLLTPGRSCDPSMVEQANKFWKMTGGETRLMSPADHDAHLAAISHVPHLVSALVARMVPPAARSLVGSGWQDITRVAAGDPEMWTAICRENKPQIIQELARLSKELDRLRAIVEDSNSDGLTQWLTEAKRVKEQN